MRVAEEALLAWMLHLTSLRGAGSTSRSEQDHRSRSRDVEETRASESLVWAGSLPDCDYITIAALLYLSEFAGYSSLLGPGTMLLPFPPPFPPCAMHPREATSPGP